eukprot:SAG22_NODE_3865_length_1493_cov_1.964849_3_plen_39_part_01
MSQGYFDEVVCRWSPDEQEALHFLPPGAGGGRLQGVLTQ